MKKRDYILIIIVALVAFSGILINSFNGPNFVGKNHITIYQGEEVYRKAAIDEDQNIVIKGNDHFNEIIINDNKVKMKSADCKNQDCVNQRAMTAENIEQRILQNWIICLPNQISIEFIKSKESN